MQLPTLHVSFAAFLITTTAAAAINPSIVGTWSTKSGKVLTGPGFYDSSKEQFTEPALTGISYSFTADGYYEEAYYRAVPNPVTPKCPGALIQWQHGTFTQADNSSLVLQPIPIDGRQLISNPCEYDTSILTRFSAPELISNWSVYTDTYNNRQRLDLYQWDGTPLNPMWLISTAPQMLPTTTLHPENGASKTASVDATTATAAKYVKRHVGEAAEHVVFPVHEALLKKNLKVPTNMHSERWFWAGIGMTGLGGVLFMLS